MNCFHRKSFRHSLTRYFHYSTVNGQERVPAFVYTEKGLALAVNSCLVYCVHGSDKLLFSRTILRSWKTSWSKLPPSTGRKYSAFLRIRYQLVSQPTSPLWEWDRLKCFFSTCIAVSLSNLPTGKLNVTEFGSMLFVKNVSGTRYMYIHVCFPNYTCSCTSPFSILQPILYVLLVYALYYCACVYHWFIFCT